MAYSYLLFKPKRSPLTAAELGLDTVDCITDLAEAKLELAKVFPALTWTPEGWGRGETADGKWIEFAIPQDGTLYLRCSLRADYSADVQRLCDLLGWVACDERPRLFQRGLPPTDC